MKKFSGIALAGLAALGLGLLADHYWLDSRALTGMTGMAKKVLEMGAGKEALHRNRLQYSKSPYLLQHADNPVDWYPWGEEAFEKARRENKPVFLSIGYSTCHWCHVMEHESFENSTVAALMNEAFVSIKVDREERPEIDKVYMTVCQMLTGGGGWPLTIILTPDKQPFFAGTYFPKSGRYGRIGMLELVPRVRELWRTRPEDLKQDAGKITRALEETAAGDSVAEPARLDLDRAYEDLAARFDSANGGFGGAPKFPTPHNLNFLLRYWKRTGEEKALAMVTKTLEALRLGGICDHLGYGFHRYSTDALWRVPHFEKMLYDQALIAIACLETYQATGKPLFAEMAREIFTYVLRDLRAPEGGFYSAEDADSEGEEGKFYLWTVEQVREALAPEEAELAVRVFNLAPEGNYSDPAADSSSGANILYLKKDIPALAAELGFKPEELAEKLEKVRAKLFALREKRVHPGKDTKVLTDWNGLMIAALAQGARVLDEPQYEKAARKAAAFVLSSLRDSRGRLLHRFADGESGITANLDDYAFTVQALLELYETTFEPSYLKTALELNRDLLAHFQDSGGAGGFYFTAEDAEALLVRQKEYYDGALPSGNAVEALNLLRLGRLTGDTALEERAAGLLETFTPLARQAPSGFTQFLCAADFAFGPTFEIVIAEGGDSSGAARMLKALRSRFLPGKVVLLRPAGDSPEICRLAPFTSTQSSIDGRATAYVCRNYNCKLPTTDAVEMLSLLEEENHADK